jgi:hypothetical protein
MSGTETHLKDNGLGGMEVVVDGYGEGEVVGSYQPAPAEYPDVRRVVVALEDGGEVDTSKDRVEVA